MAEQFTKKAVNKAFANAKEGSLTKLGWPNAGKLVEAARSNRKKVVGKLLLLANASGDPATKAKAKAIIERIKRELG
jgi:hypothetical protein